MLLNDVFNVCADKNELLAFLQLKGLVKSNNLCKKCSKMCIIVEEGEKFKFRCNSCANKFGLAPKGYFLHNAKISYENVLKMIYFFVNEIRVWQVEVMLGISKTTIGDYFNLCREICFEALQRSKRKIGGCGKTVEIDESMFGKRKYNRGKKVAGVWVVGGIERESKDCFLRIVERRDEKTLLSVIKEHVEEGTKIVTDEWRGYKSITNFNYLHSTVNHSKGFKNPETGETTNKIEGCWAQVRKIKYRK